MSVAQRFGVMSVMELVASVRRRMETGALASEAVDAVFNPTLMAPEALIELARYGAIRMANDSEHKVRQGAAQDERNGKQGPTQAQKVTSLLRAIRHKGADGVLRPLWEFTVEDWRTFAVTAHDQSRGWAARAKVAKRAVVLMEQEGVEMTRKLPTHLIAELTEKVGEAW